MSGDTPKPEHACVRPEGSKGSLGRSTQSAESTRWAAPSPEAYAQGWSGASAVRVIVCQWSRTRHELKLNGKSGVGG